jgi:hypothetical protein
MPVVNRQLRRKTARAVKKEGGTNNFLLKGGPMDGWLVGPDAAALTMGKRWGEPIGAKGQYVITRQPTAKAEGRARWESDD